MTTAAESSETREAAARDTPAGYFRRNATVLLALLALALFLLLIAVISPSFYRPANLFNVLRQASVLGIVTLGQALVLLVAGIDLSVGAVIGLTLVIIADLSRGDGMSLPGVVLVVLAFGAGVGFLNGALVTLRNVPPFVATLGMAVFLEGVRLAYTGGIPSGQIPDAIRPLGLRGVGVFPYALMLWLGIVAVMYVLLNRASYGRMVYTTGTNRNAAHLLGIPVQRTVWSAYIICGMLAATAGLVASAHAGYVDRNIGVGFDLDSIAAAVVGGVAFTGGKGHVFGVVIGVLFLVALVNLVVLLGVDPNLRLVVRGLVIVGAVGYLALRQKRRATD